MTDRFPACLPFILQMEGGNDDDPHDPGGRTSRGVIQREYDAYRARKGEPHQDVWHASDSEIADIYQHQYWQPYCPLMPAGVDLEYFDMCVNNGPHEAAILLQRALGVNADGRIGLVTEAAIAKANPRDLIVQISQHRAAFYRALSTFKYFGRGWINRVDFIEGAAMKLAAVPA